MKFEIKKVKNGFKVKCLDYESDNGDNEIVVSENRYDFFDDEDAEDVELWRCLLNEMLCAWGPSGSKWSAKRVRICAFPGNSFEGDVSKEYYEELQQTFQDSADALRTINRHRRSLKKNQE